MLFAFANTEASSHTSYLIQLLKSGPDTNARQTDKYNLINLTVNTGQRVCCLSGLLPREQTPDVARARIISVADPPSSPARKWIRNERGQPGIRRFE